MFIIGFTGTELHPDDVVVQAILAQRVGGVILYGEDNIRNPEQLKQLTQQLQAYAKQSAKSHNNKLYPLLIGVDYEGGKVNPLKENLGFPKTFSAAEIASATNKEADQQAKKMAETLAREGLNLTFTPAIDVNVNPLSPAIGKWGRSFSRNPKKVIKYAGIFSRQYKKQGIICVYKHFPGHGSSTKDTHDGIVDITDTWRNSELMPYKSLLKKNYACPIVMVGHLVHQGLDPQGYPASLSQAISTGILRKKLNFSGIIMTDDMEMKAIVDHYGLVDSITLAVNAGADILIFAGPYTSETMDPKRLTDILYENIKAGKISQKKVEQAFQRIMKLKKEMRNKD